LKTTDPHLFGFLKKLIKKVVTEVCKALSPVNAVELERAVTENPGKIETSVTASAAELYATSKPASVERRVLRAVLIYKLEPVDLEELGRRPDAHFATMNQEAIARARADAQRIKEGQVLKCEPITRARVNDESIKHVVEHILSERNVGFLSWGTKRVQLQHETVVLPSMVRRRTRTSMYKAYKEEIAQATAANPRVAGIGESLFFTICSTITNGQKRALTAVDYMLGTCIFDNFRTVERIIKLYTNPSEHKTLQLHAKLASNFLKTSFIRHAGLDGDTLNCYHGLTYALERPTRDNNRTDMNCNACRFVPYFFDELRRAVVEANRTYDGPQNSTLSSDHAVKAVLQAESLCTIWRGQCARVANQRMAIQRLHQELADKCIERKASRPIAAHIVMDFKMKYNAKYYRQKTIEHFGKRGISWHGFLVIYYIYNDATGKAERMHVYCDQIVQGTNCQDGHLVVGLVEAFLRSLKTSDAFQSLESVSLQADNANYYHSVNLILGLPFAGLAAKLPVTRYIHTETCDGKGLIDAHFAMGMRTVDNYIGTGENASGPGQVFTALTYEGGIKNSFAMLVSFARDFVEERARVPVVAAALEALKKITRQNDIEYELQQPSAAAFDPKNPTTWPGVTLKTSQFTGIGSPVTYELDMSTGALTLVGGDESDVGQGDAVQGDGQGDGQGDAAGDEDVGTAPPLVAQECGTPGAFGTTINKIKFPSVFPHVQMIERAAVAKALGGPQFADAGGAGDAAAAAAADAAGGLVLLGDAAGITDDNESDDGSAGGARAEEEEEEEEEGEVEMEEVDEGVQYIPAAALAPAAGALGGAAATAAGAPANTPGKAGAAAGRTSRRALDRAVIIAHDLSTSPESGLAIRDGDAEHPEYLLANDFVPKTFAWRGWARRPRHGHKMGTTLAGPYRDAIATLFVSDAQSKLSASYIIEQLQDGNGNQYRLDIPTESDVRKELSKLVAFRKKQLTEDKPVDYDAYRDFLANIKEQTCSAHAAFVDRCRASDGL
jgi:hypothetical protein